MELKTENAPTIEEAVWLATMIAKNRRESVVGVKALLLRDMGCTLEDQWANERDKQTHIACQERKRYRYSSCVVVRCSSV